MTEIDSVECLRYAIFRVESVVKSERQLAPRAKKMARFEMREGAGDSSAKNFVQRVWLVFRNRSEEECIERKKLT